MIEPVSVRFSVACAPAQAFALWTEQVSLWWPADHTVSQEPDVCVTFEGKVGGRIFERTASGREIDWGSVVAWEPPRRVVYRWHLMLEPIDATEVEVNFAAEAGGRTEVAIEHRGWDMLGSAGPSRRDRNEAGWRGIIPSYSGACAG